LFLGTGNSADFHVKQKAPVFHSFLTLFINKKILQRHITLERPPHLPVIILFLTFARCQKHRHLLSTVLAPPVIQLGHICLITLVCFGPTKCQVFQLRVDELISVEALVGGVLGEGEELGEREGGVWLGFEVLLDLVV
jgi:hypothetical protein